MKLRFSLLTMVLLSTVVALSFGLWRQNRRIAPLQSELDRLKYELGVVEVRDPNRMFLNQASRTPDFYRHLVFRVYVPPGNSSRATLRVNEEQRGRKSAGAFHAVLPAGHSVLEMWITRSAAGDKWEYALLESESAGSSGDGPMPPWFADDGAPLGMEFLTFPPEGLGEGETAEIIRRSIVRGDGTKVDVILEVGLNALESKSSRSAP